MIVKGQGHIYLKPIDGTIFFFIFGGGCLYLAQLLLMVCRLKVSDRQYDLVVKSQVHTCLKPEYSSSFIFLLRVFIFGTTIAYGVWNQTKVPDHC